jgi:acyl-CoA hydrolase
MKEPFSVEPVKLIEEVFPQDTNAYDTLFGGRLLGLMDKAAGIVCSKFAHREFVTISVDRFVFKRPAYQGDLLEVTSRVVYTSTHSAGCHVVAKRLTKSDWEASEICSGFFFMVAVDSQLRPIPIPQFTPTTAEEKALHQEATRIRAVMLDSRKNE